MAAKSDRERVTGANSERAGAASSAPAANKIYRTAEEVAEVRRKFETCAFAPEEFDHTAHLLVTLCYLRETSAAEALARMRANLLSFLAHYELPRVYNETITRFWLERVRALLAGAGQERSLASLANEVIARSGEAKLIFAYYSRERLATEEAANGWVEPDARPLDF